MASKYWIKLYHEILDDPKMGRLSDKLWRRAIELFLIAGDYEQDGELPPFGDIAWRLRIGDDELAADLTALEQVGIIAQNGARHIVTNFVKRQAANSVNERVRRYRDRNRTSNAEVTDNVTTRYTDIDIDIDKEEDTDTEDSCASAPSATADLSLILESWRSLFPDKPQPKPTTGTLQRQAKTRMKAPDFRAGWQSALQRAAKSTWLKTQFPGFDLYWFLKNDDNWRKCLAGNYDDRNNGNGRNGTPAKPSNGKPPELSDDDWMAIQYIHYNHDADAHEYRAELEAKGVNADDYLKTVS